MSRSLALGLISAVSASSWEKKKSFYTPDRIECGPKRCTVAALVHIKSDGFEAELRLSTCGAGDRLPIGRELRGGRRERANHSGRTAALPLGSLQQHQPPGAAAVLQLHLRQDEAAPLQAVRPLGSLAVARRSKCVPKTHALS